MPRATAQQVILELLRNGKGEWVGKTKLFKAFYFAHLYYADERPGILTDWPIAHMPEGPGIHDSAKLFAELVREGCLTIDRVHEGPYPEQRYQLTDKGATALPLPEDARKAIKRAADYALPLRASELSEITHEHSRSWQQGSNGQVLNIYIDLIPDDEYQAGEATFANLEEALGQA